MPKPATLTDGAYAAIRDRIAQGKLAPGTDVSEASLARELGLSRTPIGEALRRLSHEGLVDQVPRYGTIVRQASAEELRELYEIREALEGMAASKAASRITPVALSEMATLCDTIEAELADTEADGRTVMQGDSLRRFLAADMAFHMLILASAGNRRLTDLIENTRSVSSMFHAHRGDHTTDRIRHANVTHRAILQALGERDAAEATRLVVDHIRTSCAQSLAALATPAPVTLKTIELPASVRQTLVRDG